MLIGVDISERCVLRANLRYIRLLVKKDAIHRPTCRNKTTLTHTVTKNGQKEIKE